MMRKLGTTKVTQTISVPVLTAMSAEGYQRSTVVCLWFISSAAVTRKSVQSMEVEVWGWDTSL